MTKADVNELSLHRVAVEEAEKRRKSESGGEVNSETEKDISMAAAQDMVANENEKKE